MIKVNYRALGMLSTNCYVVENPDSQKVLIVDPGDSPLEIERQIDEIDGDPEAILLHELAEYYGTAVIPARVRHPKDKPNAEGNVGHVSTWIIAALRDGKFFSLEELNQSIQLKLKAYNDRSFQKKTGSRSSLFQEEELPYLAKLPAVPYETAEWKQATVQYNYHISVDQMLYSVRKT